MNQASEQKKINPTISLLDEVPNVSASLIHTMTLNVPYNTIPELSETELSNASFLLEKSLQVSSLGWAGQLLQPTIDDLVNQQWLSRATDEKLNLLQVDYIRILSQVRITSSLINND